MNRFATGHVSPLPKRRKYRSYSPTMLTNAYLDVVEKKTSVYKAARKYSVTEQTLRDRVMGAIAPETTKSGPEPLFSQEEEARLVKHIKQIAAVGYGYTRAEVVNLGTEFAICLEKRDREHPLSLQWFYSFMDRWPELKVRRPKTITELRAKATSRESIERYFKELGTILDKYNLKDKPECIYNVDEKGIQQNHSPSFVVADADIVPEVITSEKSSTTTVLGCGNALGYQIPPYFIFAGARMREELLAGCTPGTVGTVSQSGWSNAEIFQAYLRNHFIRYARGGSGDQKILLLYDGHRSHISPNLIDWAVENNIILYVLPPHTSHILQPMDVGCFGPFSKIFSNECQKFQRSHSGCVNRYSVCSVACKAYTAALSPENLKGAFRRAGIYPYNPSAISASAFLASDTRKELQSDDTPATVQSDHEQPRMEVPAEDQLETDMNDSQASTIPYNVSDEEQSLHSELEKPRQSPSSFFKAKATIPFFQKPEKQRRSINKIVGGKSITEPDVVQKVKDYLSESSKSSKKSSCSTSVKTKGVKKFVPPLKSNSTPVQLSKPEKEKPKKSAKQASSHCEPGPSGLQPVLISDEDSLDFDSDSSYENSVDMPEKDKCCVCKHYRPRLMKTNIYFTIPKWVQCDFPECRHWVHLSYCVETRVVRRGDVFYCPCHPNSGIQVQEEE